MFQDKYRPQNVKQLIGEIQQNTAKTLLNEVHQKVMLVGGTGSGKTTIALLYIKSLNVKDYVYWNCVEKSGVDDIRGLINEMQFKPMPPNKYTVILLDELHGLSRQAQNALLIPIENLPPHVIVIACTSEYDKLIPALKGHRFKVVNIPNPNNNQIAKLISFIAIKENIKDIAIWKDGIVVQNQQLLDSLVMDSQGSFRSAVSLLENYKDGVYSPYIPDDKEGSLLHAIYNGDKPSNIFKLAKKDQNYGSVAAGLVGYAIVMVEKGIKLEKSYKIIQAFENPTQMNKYQFYAALLKVI